MYKRLLKPHPNHLLSVCKDIQGNALITKIILFIYIEKAYD